MTDESEGELYSRDFDLCTKLERSRCAAMPDVPTLAVYDALMKWIVADVSTVFRIMEELGRKCDDESDGECVIDERAWLEEGRHVVKRYVEKKREP
jgi:hypothetical protein